MPCDPWHDFGEAPVDCDVIKKVWEADPLLCPRCGTEMRIVALIDEATVIERILRHLGLWEEGVRVDSSRGPPAPITETIILLRLSATAGRLNPSIIYFRPVRHSFERRRNYEDEPVFC